MAKLRQLAGDQTESLPVRTENSVRFENAEVTIIREMMVASTMNSVLVALFALFPSSFQSRAALQAEIVALRHQLAVLHKNAPPRLRLQRSDRWLWLLLSRCWSGWRPCLQIVQPDTVVRWHRRAFAWYWTRKSRQRPGRPKVGTEIRDLIRRMSQADPLWGAPRIHGELRKLGIAVAQSTVARYLPRPRKPPSQTWRPFLTNHLAQTAAIDFFTVPTATFRILFVFVVLSHHRRRVLHFGVTEHPTQEWTIQQMREAFPWEQAPQYVLRDRDAIYGSEFAAATRGMGMEEVLSAPRSPWQNPYVERLVGSIRRECLDHVIVWNRRSLHRILQSYFAYYQNARTHLSLAKDAPEPRAWNRRNRGAWSRFRRSADYTTDASDTLPSRCLSRGPPPAFPFIRQRRTFRSSAIGTFTSHEPTPVSRGTGYGRCQHDPTVTVAGHQLEPQHSIRSPEHRKQGFR